MSAELQNKWLSLITKGIFRGGGLLLLLSVKVKK